MPLHMVDVRHSVSVRVREIRDEVRDRVVALIQPDGYGVT
jgi:hypothetical protein